MRVLFIDCEDDLLDAADLASTLIEDPDLTDKIISFAQPYNPILRGKRGREYRVKRTSSKQLTIWRIAE